MSPECRFASHFSASSPTLSGLRLRQRSQARQLTPPKPVRHPTGCSFASSCFPPRLAATQLLSTTCAVTPHGRDSHPADEASSRTHDRRPSAGNFRRARKPDRPASLAALLPSRCPARRLARTGWTPAVRSAAGPIWTAGILRGERGRSNAPLPSLTILPRLSQRSARHSCSPHTLRRTRLRRARSRRMPGNAPRERCVLIRKAVPVAYGRVARSVAFRAGPRAKPLEEAHRAFPPLPFFDFDALERAARARQRIRPWQSRPTAPRLGPNHQ